MTAEFKCPHCECAIDAAAIARFLASRGGAKSRRKLTSDVARAMAERSHAVRRRRKAAKLAVREDAP
jgi:hypothetical protein